MLDLEDSAIPWDAVLASDEEACERYLCKDTVSEKRFPRAGGLPRGAAV